MWKNKYLFTAVMLSAILAVYIGFTTLYAGFSGQKPQEKEITVVTSFYPVYIAAMNVIGDAENVRLQNLSEPQTGCLHDFQLTPEDMKLLSTADVFIVNGGGIETFMKDVASAYPNLVIVEACEFAELLSDGDETNAHAWLGVSCYRDMVQGIAEGLADADRVHGDLYRKNAAKYDEKLIKLQEKQQDTVRKLSGKNVVLFHEAFDYIAQDYGMNVSCVLDLDEERPVSAGEVSGVLSAVRDENANLILAEKLYGKGVADAVQKEADVTIVYLNPLNRGEYEKDSYLKGMEQNINLLQEI